MIPQLPILSSSLFLSLSFSLSAVVSFAYPCIMQFLVPYPSALPLLCNFLNFNSISRKLWPPIVSESYSSFLQTNSMLEHLLQAYRMWYVFHIVRIEKCIFKYFHLSCNIWCFVICKVAIFKLFINILMLTDVFICGWIHLLRKHLRLLYIYLLYIHIIIHFVRK